MGRAPVHFRRSQESVTEATLRISAGYLSPDLLRVQDHLLLYHPGPLGDSQQMRLEARLQTSRNFESCFTPSVRRDEAETRQVAELDEKSVRVEGAPVAFLPHRNEPTAPDPVDRTKVDPPGTTSVHVRDLVRSRGRAA